MSENVKKILITGTHSYVGGAVAAHLAGWPDRYRTDTVSLRSGDWRQMSFRGYDAVFHVAGLAHADTGRATEEDKARYYAVNTELTLEAARKAKAEGVGQFLFMSSAIVYGESAPPGETKRITRATPPAPANFYGDSKLRAEDGLAALRDGGFRVAVLRAPMIYGKGSRGNYPVLARLAQRLPAFPRVENERSVLYIENLAEFVRLLIDDGADGLFWPQNGEYVSTSDLVARIAAAHGKKILLVPGCTGALRLLSRRSALVAKAFGSLSYAQDLSGYGADYRLVSLEESIRRTET